MVIERAIVALAVLLMAGSAFAQTSPVYNVETRPPRGFMPMADQLSSPVDSIEPSSGKLHVQIPLASLPAGPAGSGFDLDLNYDSNIFDLFPEMLVGFSGLFQVVEPAYELSPISRNGGWTYNVNNYFLEGELRADASMASPCPGSSQAQARFYRLRAQLPDGSLHVLHLSGYGESFTGDQYSADGFFGVAPDGRGSACSIAAGWPAQLTGWLTYYTSDGSYLKLEIYADGSDWTTKEWRLYFPDGRRVVRKTDSSLELYDANNNLVVIRQWCVDFPTCNSPYTTVTDAAGRQVRIDYGEPTQTQTFVSRRDQVSVEGPAGTKTWTVDWEPFNIGGNGRTYFWSWADWNHTHELDLWITVVKSVQLPLAPAAPVGQMPPVWNSYSLGYSDNTDAGFGELDSMRLPGGALYEYRYELEGQTASTVNGWKNPVKEKKVSVGGPGQQETLLWTYTRPPDSQPRLITTRPDGSQVTHWFFPSGPYENPSNSFLAEGLVYRIDEQLGSMRKRVWAQNMPPDVLGGLSRSPINPYVQRETVTVGSSQGSPSQTTVTDYKIDKNGNSTEIRAYDWAAYNPNGPESGQTLKRIVKNTYWVQTPDATASGDSCSPSSHDCGYWRPQSATPWASNNARRIDAVRRTEVRLNDASPLLAIAEMDYDDRFGRGNVTVERRWDSEKVPSAPTGSLADSNSQVTTRAFDTRGNVTAIHEPRVNPAEDIHTRITYGNGIYPTQVDFGFGTSAKRTWTYDWNLAAGTLSSQTDFDNGVTTSYTYDIVGRQTAIVEGKTLASSAGLRKTETIFDDQNLKVTVRRDLRTLGDGRLQAETQYDALGRPVLVRSSEPGNADGIKVKTIYHTGANHTIQSTPYRSEGEPGMEWTCTQTDTLQRVIAIAAYSGAQPANCGLAANRTAVSTIAYDGNASVVTDPANAVRRELRDGLNRVIQVAEDPSALNYSTSYVYDAQDNLTQVTQGTQTRMFNYTSLSRLKSAFNPENGWTTFTYYDSGDLKTRTDARGAVALLDYDVLRRIKSKTYTDIEQTPAVTYAYHLANTAGGYNIGQLQSVGSPVAESRNEKYDALGRVVSSRHTVTGNATDYTFGYSYFLNDGVQKVINPSGRALSYDVDDAGRIAKLSGAVGIAIPKVYADLTPSTLGATVPYTADGRIAAMKLGNGLWEARSYQLLVPVESRVTTTYSVGTVKNGQDRLSLEYNFSSTQNNGNLLSHVIRSGSQVWNQKFAYDGVNRLICAAENTSLPVNACADGYWRQTYGYDRWGNRWVSFSSNTLLWDDPHEPETASNFTAPTTYFGGGSNHLSFNGADYDQAGNQTFYAPWILSYDAENRNVRISSSADSNGTFSYDGDGRRVKKVWTPSGSSIPTTTYYLYNALGQLAAEYSTQAASTSTHYIHSDMLGSTRLVTDATGAPVECYDYLPFGRMLSQNVTGRNSCYPQSPDFALNSRLPQKFTGKERDSETRLDYFGARFYSGPEGRFITADGSAYGVAPRDPQSWNLYSYVRNRPFSYIDANGKWATSLHADMTTIALSGYLSAGELRTINAQHYKMDSDSISGVSPTFEHGMLDQDQKPGVGKALMENSIALNLRLASGLGTKTALEAFGRALHTKQDFLSPVHSSDSGQMLPWTGYFNTPAIAHRRGEDSFEDSWYRFGQAIRATLAAFIEAAPDKAKAVGITPQTLEGVFRRRVTEYLDGYLFGSSSSIDEREAIRLCALGNPAACVK